MFQQYPVLPCVCRKLLQVKLFPELESLSSEAEVILWLPLHCCVVASGAVKGVCGIHLV